MTASPVPAGTPVLTVISTAQNCADYAEVFLRSAATTGFRRGDPVEFVLLVGESDDGTEAACRELAPRIPVPTEVLYVPDLPEPVRRRMAEAQTTNDGFFSEGMWAPLIEHRPVTTPLYAGIHIDVEFVAHGLWDFLLERLGSAAVAGVFHPGELIESEGRFRLQLPRFFPVVTIVDRQKAEAVALSWGRSAPHPPGAVVIEDNGTVALQRALRSGISLIREEELERYIRHFGFLWTSRVYSAVHEDDGARSRGALSTRLALLREGDTASAAAAPCALSRARGVRPTPRPNAPPPAPGPPA